MLISAAPQNRSTALLVEALLSALAVTVPLLFPRLGSAWFARIERLFLHLARRPLLAVTCVGFSVLCLRAAILPLFSVPLPSVPNDFSFLLAADTFAHGRLTNPMPAMWTHFESIDITVRPTYMSMFFPGWGLALAAGQVLFGSPWIASLGFDALMCAAICWMLQAWLPPGWALLGGLLAVLRIGLFTIWINTISGGNALLDAFAGALVLGALPRLIRRGRIRCGLILAAGIAILAITRPFEGLLLCLPVAAALGRWAWNGKNRPAPAVLLRRAALPLVLLLGALAWLGYYDYRNFASPFTLPYSLDLAQYAIAPKFVFQSPRPEPHYLHPFMRGYYVQDELAHFNAIHSLSGYLPSTFGKFVFATIFLAGFALLPPLIMSRRVLLDRRLRLLAVCVAMLALGMMLESFFIPEYLAPFTAAFYALGLQAMRHLRVWRPAGAPTGQAILRLSVMVCVLVAAFTILDAAASGRTPSSGPSQPGSQRAQIKARLDQLPGKQLVFVRYLTTHDPTDIWIYNRAGLDHAKILWAWDMGSADNLELMRYYPGRKAWLVEPDTDPVTLVPYLVTAQTLAGSPKPSSPGN
jgi:hypothetical protein